MGKKRRGGKITRFDLGEVGSEPSVLAEPNLGWGIRLHTSRIAFQPQILGDFLSNSARGEGRVSKSAAKCFHCSLFSIDVSISESVTANY